MDTFGVRDWGGFDKWLYEATGIKNYGLKPVMGFDGTAAMLNQTMDKFLGAFQALVIENEELRQENRLLKEQLAPRTEDVMEKLATMAEAIEPVIAAQLPLPGSTEMRLQESVNNPAGLSPTTRVKVRLVRKRIPKTDTQTLLTENP
jgi:hypothetical protein